ncbi:MAG: hypothetical protein DRP06_04520 [Candidatus Aenigmatarchaeota archaeon]|nr:MAG: hypothetical protein DRP06_04520 [Candidatus Aenigmarchaeota archaeon]
MEIDFELINSFVNIITFLKTIILVVIVYVVFITCLNIVKKHLLKLVKTKKQKSNVEIFSRVLKYAVVMIVVGVAIAAYSGSWTSFALTAGLFSAALGWALQKPITGIAAWIMVITTRPFEIGDRITIGAVRGDVTDVKLTHIYISEIGGIIGGEETSGRIVMVPNSILFEQNLINYTSKDEYILDQVVPMITYESDLKKATKICLEVAKEVTKEFIEKTKGEPYVRTYFSPNGLSIHVRYFAPAKRLQEISGRITEDIFNNLSKAKGIKLSYPHREITINEKERVKIRK